MKLVYKILSAALMALLVSSLSGCFQYGKSSDNNTNSFANADIMITVHGLTPGQTVVVDWKGTSADNGAVIVDAKPLTMKFVYAVNNYDWIRANLTQSPKSIGTIVGSNIDWELQVTQQPTNGQICTFNPSKGNLDEYFHATADLYCSPQKSYTVTATVSGLASGEQVVLNNNGTDPLTLTSNGSATTSGTFSKQIALNGGYDVTVTQSPTGKTCTANAATGTGVTANVNVNVTCAPQSFTVGGNITGLPACRPPHSSR